MINLSEPLLKKQNKTKQNKKRTLELGQRQPMVAGTKEMV